MGLFWQQEKFAYTIKVWKIEEQALFFEQALDLDREAVLKLKQRFKHTENRLQWLASRFLLKSLIGEAYRNIQLSAKGKWHLPAGQFLFSLSHSGVYVAAIKSIFAVGIDIQIRTAKLSRIATKYIPAHQLAKLRNSRCREDLYHVHWGIKEALFKAYGEGGLDYKKHLIVPVDSLPNERNVSTEAFLEKSEQKIVYQAKVKIWPALFLAWVRKGQKTTID